MSFSCRVSNHYSVIVQSVARSQYGLLSRTVRCLAFVKAVGPTSCSIGHTSRYYDNPLLGVYSHMDVKYDGWNFNFGNTPLDWSQELLE